MGTYGAGFAGGWGKCAGGDEGAAFEEGGVVSRQEGVPKERPRKRTPLTIAHAGPLTRLAPLPLVVLLEEIINTVAVAVIRTDEAGHRRSVAPVHSVYKVPTLYKYYHQAKRPFLKVIIVLWSSSCYIPTVHTKVTSASLYHPNIRHLKEPFTTSLVVHSWRG